VIPNPELYALKYKGREKLRNSIGLGLKSNILANPNSPIGFAKI
jgi:hypothetical protein